MEVFGISRGSAQVIAAKQNNEENSVTESTNWNDVVLKSGHWVS